MKSNEEFIQGIYQKYHQRKGKGIKEIQENSYISFTKIAACFIIVTLLASGTILGVRAYQKLLAKMQPVYTGTMDENAVWVGTFQLAWNELMDIRMKGKKIEFADGNPDIVEQLNKRSFTKEMLSPESYYIKVEQAQPSLKQQMQQEIQDKFGTQSTVLDQLNWNPIPSDSYLLYAMLKKEFTFPLPFDKVMYKSPFASSEKKVSYFGIINSSEEELNDNVIVSFFTPKESTIPGTYHAQGKEFGVRLKTKEGEEVILYRTDNKTASFEELYEEFLEKEKNYTGSRTFNESDELLIPYISIHADVSYKDLCGKEIKGTNGLYIINAIQNVSFHLNEKGGKVQSEAALQDIYLSISEDPRFFYFTDRFVIFMKEKEKEKPYFALSIDNTDYLLDN